MIASLHQFILDYLLLFSVVNVLGNLPTISTLTDHLKRRQRDKAFNISVLSGGLIAASCAYAVYAVLVYIFGLEVKILTMICAIWLIIVSMYGIIMRTNQIFLSKFKSRNPAVVPMGFPLLAGPGTVAAILLLMLSEGWLLTSILIIVVYISALPLLQLTSFVKSKNGRIWTAIIARGLYAYVCFKGISLLLNFF